MFSGVMVGSERWCLDDIVAFEPNPRHQGLPRVSAHPFRGRITLPALTEVGQAHARLHVVRQC